jgi:hypothetical protein
VSDYQQTLPSLECDEWKKECIAASTSLATNTFCLSFVCGNKTAVTPMSSTPSSSAGGENPSSTATATGGPETSASHSAATALRAGRDYGTGALAFGLVSLFALLL